MGQESGGERRSDSSEADRTGLSRIILDRRTLLLAGGAALAGTGAGALHILDAPRPAQAARLDGPISAGLRSAYANALRHFHDPVGRHIRPTNGGAPVAITGLVDTSAETPFPSAWQMECLANPIFNRWLIEKDAEAQRMLADQWFYMRTVRRSDTGALAFPPSVLAGQGIGVTVNTFDDAVWWCTFLMHVHAATGDRLALACLAKSIASFCTHFLDPNTSGNPTIDYGAAAGAPFRCGAFGSLYATPGGTGFAQFGLVSSSIEAGMALCALYVFQALGTRPYLRYAINTYGWIQAKLRTPRPADATRKAEALYEAELILNPHGDTGAAESSGGAFLTPRNAIFGKPIRGLDSTWQTAAFAMAVLAARLYRQTGQDMYRADANRISEGIVSLQGYGRIVGGKLLIQDTRDPWSGGHYVVPWAIESLALPGAPAAAGTALVNTAAYMLAYNSRPSAGVLPGYLAGEWAGPERNFNDGTSTWLELYKRAPGNQGSPAQIMTTGEALCVLQAAAWIESL